jgi:HlyD family secretion protein
MSKPRFRLAGTELTRYAVIIPLLLALLTAGCSALSGQAEETAEPEEIDTGPEVISATGEVRPAKEATLGFETGGRVIELLVEEGDIVEAGDVIARLDITVLEAQVEQAEAGLDVAKAELKRAEAGSRAEEIDEAEQQLAASNASVTEAVAQRDDVQSGASEVDIAKAKADVQAAFIAMINKRAERDTVRRMVENIGDYRLIIKFLYNKGAIEQKQEELDILLMNLEEAQGYLDDLLAEPNADDLRVAEAEVWAAAADYQASEAQLNLLLAGPRPETIAVAEAGVEQAEAALNTAKLALEKAELVAPFDGTISDVFIQEAQYVNPGEAVVLIADLSGLRVETTDLNEIDVAGIKVGDKATVTFDALPEVEAKGTVAAISPKAEEGTGVNYTVTVKVDDLPDAIRWGMTAFIDIPVEQ